MKENKHQNYNFWDSSFWQSIKWNMWWCPVVFCVSTRIDKNWQIICHLIRTRPSWFNLPKSVKVNFFVICMVFIFFLFQIKLTWTKSDRGIMENIRRLGTKIKIKILFVFLPLVNLVHEKTRVYFLWCYL